MSKVLFFCVEFCGKKLVRQNSPSQKIESKIRTNGTKNSKKQSEKSKKTIKSVKIKKFGMKFTQNSLQNAMDR